tara:strand:- start:1368 stop:1622 length:255 start_codon:yes stop_codon:yes gene_type:complete
MAPLRGLLDLSSVKSGLAFKRASLRWASWSLAEARRSSHNSSGHGSGRMTGEPEVQEALPMAVVDNSFQVEISFENFPFAHLWV